LAPRQNCPDILFGNWHPLNLMAPPFNFPPPIQLLNEQCTEDNGNYIDKSLALWKLDDLKTSSQVIEEITDHVRHKTFNFVQTTIFNPTNIDPLTFVSIVMTTHNRKEQLLYTLESFSESVNAKLINVILVDDSTDSTAYLTEDDLIKFPFQITYITIDPQRKTWVNPCVNYNIGFNEVKTDRVIIQNAEVCHSGDIIKFVVDNLTSKNYLVFDVCVLPSIEVNRVLSTYGHQYIDVQRFLATQSWFRATHPHSWYQHSTYMNRNLHFLTAITRENLTKLDGFDNRFALGSCFDDDEILYRIHKFLKLSIQNVSNEKYHMLGIHQWHSTSM
jgi:glycosyltransferase involved in cell wall biosynthesis